MRYKPCDLFTKSIYSTKIVCTSLQNLSTLSYINNLFFFFFVVSLFVQLENHLHSSCTNTKKGASNA
ncbi:hypothetical protein CQA40_10100 [Helicobacter sp. MIT 01-3238]|nr:hypothetical protein CQA40_10100 [Helicobacter sp. MIT 01-3238]